MNLLVLTIIAGSVPVTALLLIFYYCEYKRRVAAADVTNYVITFQGNGMYRIDGPHGSVAYARSYFEARERVQTLAAEAREELESA